MHESKPNPKNSNDDRHTDYHILSRRASSLDETNTR